MQESPNKYYVVYFLVQSGIVKYCGITNDVMSRKRKHAKNKPMPHGFLIQHRGLSKIDARRIEGTYIRRYNLIEEGWNEINSAARIPGPLNYTVPKHGKIDHRKLPKPSRPADPYQNTLFN